MCRFIKAMNTIGDTFPNYPAFNTVNGTTLALGQQTSALSPRELGTEALLSMRGWLLKRKKGCFDPKNRSVFGDFNKRFFWIDSSIRLIYYSESEDKSKRVSFIPFNRLVAVSTVMEPMAINSARPGWVYGMEVRTNDRVYELWARTSSESRRWLEVLEKAASIGRAYSSAASSINLPPAVGISATSRYLDTVSPIPAGSRRGSNSSSTGVEQANTVPVVTTAPSAVECTKDDVTVVAGGMKENTGPSPNLPVLAPTKWDDWGDR